MGQKDQRLRWRPQSSRAISRIKIIWLGPQLMPPEGGDGYSWVFALILCQRRRHADLTNPKSSMYPARFRLYADSAHRKPNVVFGKALGCRARAGQVIQVSQLPALLEPVVPGNPVQHGSHPQRKTLNQPDSS